MTKNEEALINEAKRQFKLMKTARRKRLLKRFVMHFYTVLPGCIALTFGVAFGAAITGGFDGLFTKIWFICSGYIIGYIAFDKNV